MPQKSNFPFQRIMPSSSVLVCFSKILIASIVLFVSINESHGDEDLNRILVVEPEQALAESPSQPHNSQQPDEEKRSWQNLQGSWGKRNQRIAATANGLDFEHPYGNSLDDNELEMNLLMGYEPSNVPETSTDYGDELSKWGNFLRSQAAAVALKQLELIRNHQQSPVIYSENDQQKRGWKSMGGAWGKRLGSGNDWNRFRGSWGKREPGWNNLKGLWGKRSNPNNWNKLQSAWGKRDLY